ncbi:hypothetical protein GGR56DRAFT_647484 [Xylariaceae sp. FL0804]|nr:hypothetical protein GGR56DRAFT_647484 [Xylariaceae sp. FL0804]
MSGQGRPRTWLTRLLRGVTAPRNQITESTGTTCGSNQHFDSEARQNETPYTEPALQEPDSYPPAYEEPDSPPPAYSSAAAIDSTDPNSGTEITLATKAKLFAGELEKEVSVFEKRWQFYQSRYARIEGICNAFERTYNYYKTKKLVGWKAKAKDEFRTRCYHWASATADNIVKVQPWVTSSRDWAEATREWVILAEDSEANGQDQWAGAAAQFFKVYSWLYADEAKRWTAHIDLWISLAERWDSLAQKTIK